MKWIDKITECAENLTIKLQEKTIKLQKSQIHKQKEQIKTLEKLLTTVMKQRGYNKAQIFAAIHTGQLVDHDTPKNK